MIQLDIKKISMAYNALQLQPKQKSKKKLWIVIGIVVSIIVIVIFVFLWWIRDNGSFSTYPYIPTPKNTIRSNTYSELLSNILLDTNESSPDYSVISRLDVKGK